MSRVIPRKFASLAFARPTEFIGTELEIAGFATFYPASRLLGRPEFRIYAPLIPLVAAATFALAVTSWRIGLRRYSSTGS